MHLADWWGQPVLLDFTFFQTAEMCGYLSQAGFTVEDILERPPYPEIEAQTQRPYLWARKPRLAMQVTKSL